MWPHKFQSLEIFLPIRFGKKVCMSEYLGHLQMAALSKESSLYNRKGFLNVFLIQANKKLISPQPAPHPARAGVGFSSQSQERWRKFYLSSLVLFLRILLKKAYEMFKVTSMAKQEEYFLLLFHCIQKV